MKITPNHISLLLSREGSSVLVLAERKNAEQWTLQMQNEDRKDTFTEAVLQRSIDKGDLKVTSSFGVKELPPYSIGGLTLDIDTSDAVDQLAELEEQMEKTAAAGRAMLVVLAALDSSFASGGAVQQEACNRATADASLAKRIDALESATVNLKTYNAEGLNVSVVIEEPISDGLRAGTPYTPTIKLGVRVFTADDFRFAKSVEIDGKVWSRKDIGEYFESGCECATEKSIAKDVNSAKDVQTIGFAPITTYNYLTAKYSKVCADVTELSQAVTKCEEHLAQTRGQYDAACDTREKLYGELMRVHGQL